MSRSVYATRDLISATYIAYNGVKFADKYDEDTRSWIFEDPERCKQLDLQLRNGEAIIELNKYESTRRNLLGMVRDAREERRSGSTYREMD